MTREVLSKLWVAGNSIFSCLGLRTIQIMFGRFNLRAYSMDQSKEGNTVHENDVSFNKGFMVTKKVLANCQRITINPVVSS